MRPMPDKNIYCGSYHCRGGHKWVSGQWRLDSINCGAMRHRTAEELAAANKVQHDYLRKYYPELGECQ
jgi:hypothetical protein